MVNTYTTTYYSTLHDSITSICKTILPFSLKKKRLAAAEHKLSKMQSDNLKWQQESFHQILNLMGLYKEGILAQNEVAAFRSHLLEKIIVSPPDQEHTLILRDKLVFLQELLYAKCISEEEYHSSKRPLLQRLAVQGAEIDAKDVILGGPKDKAKENSDEKWTDIDLEDDNQKENSNPKHKSKHYNSAIKQIKGAASVFNFPSSSRKTGTNKQEKSIFDMEQQQQQQSHVSKKKETETQSFLMQESVQDDTNVAKRKPFKALSSKSDKKQWGFKKWKRNELEDETSPLRLNEKSDTNSYPLVSSPIGGGPDTKQIKKKLNADGSKSDFFIDKVLGEKIKKELSRIQTELCTTNQNLQFSNDQIEAISTKLPVDKADLNKFFPKSWCDRYGEVVLDVVKKEFKEHVGEMEIVRNATREKRISNSKKWTTFEDDNDDQENSHPNLFSQDYNPFWSPSTDGHVSSFKK